MRHKSSSCQFRVRRSFLPSICDRRSQIHKVSNKSTKLITKIRNEKRKFQDKKKPLEELLVSHISMQKSVQCLQNEIFCQKVNVLSNQIQQLEFYEKEKDRRRDN